MAQTAHARVKMSSRSTRPCVCFLPTKKSIVVGYNARVQLSNPLQPTISSNQPRPAKPAWLSEQTLVFSDQTRVNPLFDGSTENQWGFDGGLGHEDTV